MGILIVSSDQEAIPLLCSALGRRNAAYTWNQAPSDSDSAPLVAVFDQELSDHQARIADLARHSPWCRCYVIGPGTATEHSGPERARTAQFIAKPFDAAFVAQRLVRDAELATLERGRRTVETRADELALLVQSTFEAIIGLDRDMRIVSWNNGATRTYGFTPEAALGAHVSILTEGVDPGSSHRRPERRASQTTRCRADGKQIEVLVSRSRVNGEVPGSTLEYAEVSLDITAQAVLERDLLQSQQLATLGRISATMSHEINNPLAVIRSCAAWLKDFADQSSNDELRETADDLELASERIAGFVDQMCGLARRAPVETTRAPLSKTLESALRMVRPRAINRGVSLSVLGAHDSTLDVEHDPSRLSQAIINIVANAIDAAAERGRGVWVKIASTTSHVRIEVEDSGPGIAKEMQSRLFEAFATTKPAGHGTGIGLALTREVMAEHGGEIHLSAREGGGTVAVLEFPVGQARRSP
ncbi:MAG: Sporulation kinase [Pseudomonadota bacterium]|jgi:PAS domain S-box-containing protein